MIRRLVKTLACHGLAWARLEAWIERATPVVVGYHRVVEDPASCDAMPGLAVGVRTLERQLDWLGRRCRFVTLDELGAASRRGSTGRPVAAVTFDDGYADVHRHAYPLLVRKGIPAAVFVVSGTIGAGPLLHDRLYRALVQLEGRPLPPRVAAVLAPRVGSNAYERTRSLLGALDTDQVRRALEALEAVAGPAAGASLLGWQELRALHAGGIQIGSHTRSHALLTAENGERVAHELAASRAELEAELGVEVRHFAYPDGQFDPAVVRAVHEAGYRFGYTVCRHRDRARPWLTIPRTMLWEGSSRGLFGDVSGAVLDCQTLGGLELLDRCTRRHGD